MLSMNSETKHLKTLREPIRKYKMKNKLQNVKSKMVSGLHKSKAKLNEQKGLVHFLSNMKHS